MKSPAFKLFASVITFSMMLGACSPSASLNMAESNKSRKTNLTIAGDDLITLVDGNNAFALDIYNALHSESGNLILSPYSISLALAMTYAGARGETESQIAQVLHFAPQEQLHPALNMLDLALQKESIQMDQTQEPLKLKIANAVWAEQTTPFQTDFLDVIAVNYGAGIHLADFINQAESARVTINNWVSGQTEDRINDLLPKDSVGTDTRMVLVNAIYFKADWLTQFDANLTNDMPFYLTDGSEVTAKMMQKEMSGVPYMQGQGYQAVELAYAGETAAMDIFIPDAGNFETFETAFNQETLNETLNEMQPVSIALGMPKFEFSKDFGVSDALKQLGISDAFDSARADFSGMTGNKELYIGNVIHKAFVAVNEEGTEAAAATAVIMEGRSAPRYDVLLQIDRPFIFVIRDTVNGQILFIGRVLNPAE